MLRYRRGPESDPFYSLYNSPGWLTDYDPPRPFPFWLNLELTNRCQLDCIFCSRQKSRRPLGDLSLATARAVVAEAARHEGCGLRFTGWGEPLLHPAAADIVALVKGAGLKLKIYTNGLALTPALMDRFIELEVDDLQFSMQGLTPAQYEFNRRGASYGRLRAGLEMAAARRGQAARPFLSVLTSVLADEAAAADAEVFAADLLTLVDKVAVDLTNLNFVADQPRIQPFLASQSGGLTRGRCVDVFLALEIKYDGLIQFCGQDAEGLAEHSLGRLGEISLHEAWHSPEMNEQRQLVGRELGHATRAVCRHCFHNTTKYDLFKRTALDQP
jgi:pyruvate-formate lyase-activating enzyme